MEPKPTTTGKYPLERLPNGKPRFTGCSRVQEYKWLCKLGEGTFGEVSKAESLKTGQVVALKKILVHNGKDGFPITALRELKLLKSLNHPNVLRLVEMAVERPKDVTKRSNMFMVTPYMNHDLSGLLKNPRIQFTEPQIKCYMRQLLEGCKYLHEMRILHRDMKAANLLISNKGILQIADFGLARPYSDEPPKPGQGGGESHVAYTGLVVTRWYRPPELFLQLRKYTTAVDMWGVGCIFGEMYKRRPILQGDSDLGQAQLIFNLVGSPTEDTMPGWRSLPGCDGVVDWGNKKSTLRHQFSELSPAGLSLLEEFLRLDWRKRINAIDALEHPYFHTNPLPARPEDLPVMEESHEFDKQNRKVEHKPPPAPAGGHVGIGNQNEDGFRDRSRPYDRHGNRPPKRDRYENTRGAMRNGHLEGRLRPLRDDDHHDRPSRQDYHDRAPYEDAHDRRRPPPDTSLPPRPPAPSEQERSDDPSLARRGPPRVPPPANSRRPLPPAGEVDTYIPDYSNADPNARPPRTMLHRNYDDEREPRRPRRVPPENGRAALGQSDHDDNLPYDGPGRRSTDRDMNYGGRSVDSRHDPRIPYHRGPPSAAGSYDRDRRRSRSPSLRERVPDRERERWYNNQGYSGQYSNDRGGGNAGGGGYSASSGHFADSRR